MAKDKNYIEQAGRKILVSAFRAGKSRSRQQDKADGRADKAIYSERSLEAHKSAWKQFADWAKSAGVKNLKKVDEATVTKFLTEKAQTGGRDGKGATAKTLKGYVTAINKVMTTGKLWQDDQRVELRDLDVTVRSDREAGYKHLTAVEWRQRNPQGWNQYKDTLEVVQAFGLRRRELVELNERSFVKDSQTGKLYVQTIGKGGKFRLAECRADMAERMEQRFSQYVQELDTSRLKADNLRKVLNSERGRLNLANADASRMPRHIFRAEYAENLLKQKLTEYNQERGSEPKIVMSYRRLDQMPKSEWSRYVTKIGRYSGDARAFLEVSRALGHNRLDVLTRYI